MKNDDFDRMCNKYYSKILRWAVYKWGEQGEDAVQEAFLRAFEHKHKFNDSFSFVTWVYGFVPVIVADWRREDKLVFDRSVDVLKIPHFNSPDTFLSYTELIELCNTLPNKQREAIFERVEGEGTDSNDRKNLWWAKQVVKRAYNED